MEDIRGNRISMIFQEPMTSLNPLLTVGRQISEAIALHQGLSRREAMDRAIDMLRRVHMPEPERRARPTEPVDDSIAASVAVTHEIRRYRFKADMDTRWASDPSVEFDPEPTCAALDLLLRKLTLEPHSNARISLL